MQYIRNGGFTSGIIGQAAVAKVPVIVNDGFEMAKWVSEYNIGFVKEEQSDGADWILDNVGCNYEIEKLIFI